MAKLHTLNKPASHGDLIRQLSEAASPEDGVVLLEDGVYHVLEIYNGHSAHDFHTKVGHIYVLESDARSRGIKELCEQISFINYEQFVELSVRHDTVISWY